MNISNCPSEQLRCQALKDYCTKLLEHACCKYQIWWLVHQSHVTSSLPSVIFYGEATNICSCFLHIYYNSYAQYTVSTHTSSL